MKSKSDACIYEHGALARHTFDALLKDSPDLLFIKDLDGRFLAASESFVQFLNCDSALEVIGKTEADFLSPEVARSHRLDEQRVITSGRPRLEKTEFMQTRGLAAWYAITRLPLRNSAGETIGVVGVGRNVSEHVIGEKRERDTTKDIKAVVEIADQLIGTNDLDALLRKAIELARSHLRVERCSILLNHGDHLQGTFGTDLEGHTTYEKNIRYDIDTAWENRMRGWSDKSSQWVIEHDLERSSPDARMAGAENFWVATTPIKGADNRIIAVFCNDSVISSSPPDEHRQNIIAVFCSVLGNIIERQRGMDELQQRDHVLDGVARSASQLLIVEDMDAAIRESLRVLGESMNVDRAYIFRNHADPLTGQWLMSQRYEWARDDRLAQMNNEKLQDLPYLPPFEYMFEHMASGHTYSAVTSRLDALGRAFLEAQEVQSVLLVPIHINNQFWGFIGFDDCHSPREWSHNEKVILLAMAGNLGGAISQEQTKRELKARDRILGGVARANHELLTNPDTDAAIANALSMMASAVAMDRIFICENFVDVERRQFTMCPRFLYDRLANRLSRFSAAERRIDYTEQMPGWYEVLAAGKPIHGRVLDFISGNADQVHSVLVAPLMIEKRLWGIIGFESLKPEYNWSESEISTLATMAGSIGAAMARRRAELSLRSSEEHFRSLIENASDLILEIGRDGYLLYASPSVERELGYHNGDLATITLFDLIPPEEGPIARAMIEEAEMSPKQAILKQLKIKHRNGDWRYIECAFKMVPEEDAPPRFIINARDITMRIRAEEALRQSEDLFRHSQKMEAVGRLAGGVAHDFNNLLTAILGYGDLLLDQIPESNPLRKEVGEIYRAAERAHSLTRQLLVFSRRQVIEATSLDLNLVVKDMENFLTRLISEDIALVSSTDPVPCHVKVDRAQIEQVIVNLAVNARDAMPAGGTLTISTRNLSLPRGLTHETVSIPPGDYVQLTIADTGRGISEEIRPHIFEPFFTTKEVGKGTGLGLSMVYGSVEQCEGFILFDSALNQGTEFTIYLPRATEPEPPRTEKRPRPRAGGNETVLLLEDDAIVRELSTRILTDNGYRVITRENGALGLEYFKEHADAIDIVLTDIIMPQMSGLAFARAARQIKPDLKVLFISGYSEDQQLEARETADGRYFIQKPFTVDTLCRRVRETLDTPATEDTERL